MGGRRLDVWNEPIGDGSDTTKGVAALRVMAIEDPSGFAKLYSSLLPRELTIEAVTDLADGDVDALIERLQEELLIEHKVPAVQLEYRPEVDYNENNWHRQH